MQVPLVDLKTQYKHISKEIDRAIKNVCQTSSFIKGKPLEDFEKEFAKFLGAKYCIGVSSGTDALHLSLRALGVKEGDEVIVPTLTFVATAYAVLYVGAKPVFVDADPLTFNIDTKLIEEKITKKTKAIIPVHLYGQPCQMDKILQISKKYKLFVIEDACQSHGASFRGKKVGNFGSLSAFSFYPGKNLGAYGDGGAVVTNSLSLSKKIMTLREYGSSSKYAFDILGFNNRLDSLHASILSVKLKTLQKGNEKRQEFAKNYDKLLKDIKQITTPYQDKNLTHVYHLYVIQTKKRSQLMDYLQKKGIQAGIHYPIPLHLQKSLKNLGYKKGDFPVAEKLCSEILSLPLSPELTFKQQAYVADNIKNFFKIKG